MNFIWQHFSHFVYWLISFFFLIYLTLFLRYRVMTKLRVLIQSGNVYALVSVVLFCGLSFSHDNLFHVSINVSQSIYISRSLYLPACICGSVVNPFSVSVRLSVLSVCLCSLCACMCFWLIVILFVWFLSLLWNNNCSQTVGKQW